MTPAGPSQPNLGRVLGKPEGKLRGNVHASARPWPWKSPPSHHRVIASGAKQSHLRAKIASSLSFLAM